MTEKLTHSSNLADSLLDCRPEDILPHGPSKLFVDSYVWHQPGFGGAAAYTVTEEDVKDHFGIMRGVDQIEFFGQAITVSCGIHYIAHKEGWTLEQLHREVLFLFLGVGEVRFRSQADVGDRLVALGYFTFHKFRQGITDGRIYVVPKHYDLKELFSDFNEERLRNYDLPEDCRLVTELFGTTGKLVKKSKLEAKRQQAEKESSAS
ncbi:MAG: hypothetical protein ACPGN3_16965 [Opitutales bacterium]